DGIVDPADGEPGSDSGDGEADEGDGPQEPALDVEAAGVPHGLPWRGRGGHAGAVAGWVGICGHGVPLLVFSWYSVLESVKGGRVWAVSGSDGGRVGDAVLSSWARPWPAGLRLRVAGGLRVRGAGGW